MDHITADYFGHGYYALCRDTLLPRQQTDAECAFILKIIRPKKGRRWLDIPCAYGRHLFSLAGLESKLQLHGADINLTYMSEPGLQDCATRTCCSMERLPYRNGSFDVLLNLLNSFGYDPPQEDGDDKQSRPFLNILHEFNRVLKTGGYLVLDLPNRRPMIRLAREKPVIRYCVDQYETIETFNWEAGRQSIINSTVWKMAWWT